MPGGFGICTSRGWNTMKSSMRFKKPNASITCTNVRTTHASGDANSAFNSLRAIVKIIFPASSRMSGRQDASCLILFACQVAEDVFKARLRRRKLVKAPVFFNRAPHEFVGRIDAVGEGHATDAVAAWFDAGHSRDGRKLAHRGRMPEDEQDGAAALKLL